MSTWIIIAFWVGWVGGYFMALHDTGKVVDRLRERWKRER